MSSSDLRNPQLEVVAGSSLPRPKFLHNLMAPNASVSKPSYNENKSEIPPIFSRKKLSFLFPEQCAGDISHLIVNKNWLICIVSAATTSSISLLRYFLPRNRTTAEISLDKHLGNGHKVSKLFLDPSGHHILISLAPKTSGLASELLYIHDNGPKVRRIEKFKELEVTAVAFNVIVGNEYTTGPILLGTQKGLLFETELALDGDKPSYKKQVYDFSSGRAKYPITGLEVLRTPQNPNHCLVVVVTPDALYTFQELLRTEEKTLQSIFSPYQGGGRTHWSRIERTDLNYSVWRTYAEPNVKYPLNWGWLCGTGLMYGEIKQDNVSTEEFLVGDKQLPFDKDIDERKHLSYEERRLTVPVAFELTEFHALLMYSDRIVGICLLNKQTVYEDFFPEKLGRLLGMIRDPFTGTIYAYSEKFVFTFRVDNEQRNIWQIYLGQGLYDLAECYASNEADQDRVMCCKAENLYEKGEYLEAARAFCNTSSAFPGICLRFMDLEDKEPLILYVQTHLAKLVKQQQEQRSAHEGIFALVSWLINLYLLEINKPGRLESERRYWQSEYDTFMGLFHVVKCVRTNRDVIQKLIVQHADNHNLVQFAIVSEDYEQVVEQHILDEKYADALRVLGQQNDTDLYYKYGPILIGAMPQETVELLIAQGRKLQVSRLLPTLINIESQKHVLEVTRYIEYCIYNWSETNQAVHNYLLSLYAEHQPHKLMKYLETEGCDASLIHYEINYALSVCLQHDAKDACVFLYCVLELYHEATELALSFNKKLAKQTASKPKSEDIQRELWLRIAQAEIHESNDVVKAQELLKDCPLLCIEDMLPFFSNFEKIDNFKAPICKALKEYNRKIQEIQQEMQECSNQSETACKDLKNIRERCIRLDTSEICSCCKGFLLLKSFFVFPCGHKFHSDCLEAAIVPRLTSESSRRLTLLKQQLETAMLLPGAEESTHSSQKRSSIKRAIEELLASDCLFCGHMIDTIDQPFVEDLEQVQVDWD